jgi:formate dehydrogenase major subunit
MSMDRRKFLTLSGVSALTIAAGCTPKSEKGDMPADMGRDTAGGDVAGDMVPADTGSDIARACLSEPPGPFADTTHVKWGTQTTTICPYCGVGCGAIVTANEVNGKYQVVGVDGDPDHPINEGALCSKGSAMYQIANNPERLSKIRHRAAGASDWDAKEYTWEEAITAIAEKFKTTRDASMIHKDSLDRIVNRCESIGCMGGAALDNEEGYALRKLMTIMGLVYIEHQARI